MSRWDTLDGRSVLAVARTVTSTTRLRDALEVFRGDQRLTVTWAFDDGSEFAGTVPDFLRRSRIDRVLDWDEVAGHRFDLVVTASENVRFERVNGPSVVLPHGAGFYKYVPSSTGDGRHVAGLVAPELLRRGDITLVVAHESLVAQAEKLCPEAVGHLVVAGDPSYDQLVRSVRFAETYKESLGVHSGQRLVVVTSTWGPESLLGRCATLPAQLLAVLPADEYRVALILHPNAPAAHSSWEIARRLATAEDGGLLRIPQDSGWHAALCAADLVVADHGSVGLYAAALEKPLLLMPPAAESVRGTTAAELAMLAPRLRLDAPLREQVEAAIDGHRPGRLRSVTDRMFSPPGNALADLRRLFYRIMDLSPPDEPVRQLLAPRPRLERLQATAFQVFSEIDDDVLALRRYPPDARRDPLGGPQTRRHLAVAHDEPDGRLRDFAEIFADRNEKPRGAAERTIARALHDYPGLRFAACQTSHGCLARSADGSGFLVDDHGADLDPLLLASAGFAARTRKNIVLRLGARRVTLSVSADRSPS
ncbi:hypothetical protein [Fodinicola acaciae]|uniref:hypothetical protein n=1 Tax=Fodinicola acaciae TaxID=2681555 RepID=UPI0013D346E7|nr:hypothetical protein [Fodinicola acaciae]